MCPTCRDNEPVELSEFSQTGVGDYCQGEGQLPHGSGIDEKIGPR